MFYLRLKHDFWENYYQVVVTTGIWSLNMSKQIMKENNPHRIRFATQENIERHRKTVVEELKEAENELNKHKQLSSCSSKSIYTDYQL